MSWHRKRGSTGALNYAIPTAYEMNLSPDIIDGYVRTIRVLIQQEIMEILSLRSNAMLLSPIFYFSYFAMNIKATCSFLSLLASDTCILSKKIIKVLSSCTKSKINNHFIMSRHYFRKILIFCSLKENER
jgi:hypothetical protein